MFTNNTSFWSRCKIRCLRAFVLWFVTEPSWWQIHSTDFSCKLLQSCVAVPIYINRAYFLPRVAKLRAAGCGLRATDCIAGCGSQIAGCGLRATLILRAAGHRLRVAGHTQIAGCGPQIAGCWLICCGLRATCCGLLIMLVAKLQVAKMSCCELLNCRLRFARLFRLDGCQLLDLLGYNIWVTAGLPNKWKLFPPC